MTSLTVFAFESQEIRFVDGKPVANDVAKVLGYKSPANAVNRIVKASNKGLCDLQTPSGVQSATVLEESGIYQLIFGSKLPAAESFQQWVFSEVLPSIRKTGKYESIPQQLALPQTFSEALRCLAVEVEAKEALQQEVNLLAPKAFIYDAVMDSETWLDVRELFKCLAIPKYKEKDFRKFLCNQEVKILSKDTNQPFSGWVKSGLAKLTPVTLPNGAVYQKPVFSWKGCDKIIRAMRGHGVISDAHQIDLNLGYKIVKA